MRPRGACRSCTPPATSARCHSKGCISAASPIRTMSSSCSGKPPHNSACSLCRSGALVPTGPPLPDTMLGNRSAYEVGKSYTLKTTFDIFLSLVLQHHMQNSAAVCAVFDLVLRRKGISAEALAVQRGALLRGRYPQLAEVLQELTTLRTQISQRILVGPGSMGPIEHMQTL